MALVNALEWAGGTNTSEQINTKIEEMIASGEISGEGWAIVKTGSLIFASVAAGASSRENIDLTELGFTSPDDYMVFLSLTTISSGSSYSDITLYTTGRTATAFTLVALNTASGVASYVVASYAVVSLTQVVSPVQEALVQRVVDETIQTHTGVWERYDSTTDELVYTDDEQGLVNERRLSIAPSDSGWQQLISGSNEVLYRKIGKIVEVRIAVLDMSSLAAGALKQLGNLPSGFYSTTLPVYALGVTSNWNNIIAAYVGVDGRVVVRNISSTAITNAHINLIFSVS